MFMFSMAFGAAVCKQATNSDHDSVRTGLVSLVIGIYSLLTAFVLSPLASAIPECAIAPVLAPHLQIFT